MWLWTWLVCHDLINYKSYYAILSCSNKQITSFGHELISVLISFSVVKNLKSRQLLGMSWIWMTRLKWVKTKLSKRWHLKLMTLRSSSVTSVRLSSSQLPISSELILEPHSVRNSSRPINLKKGSRKKWAPCWMACECSQGRKCVHWITCFGWTIMWHGPSKTSAWPLLPWKGFHCLSHGFWNFSVQGRSETQS